ncbi:hypothetical protein QOT17_025137 [Balamuthia mandrillaris]
MTETRLSLKHRKDLSANTPHKENALQEIKQATGQESWRFELSEEELVDINEKVESGYRDRLGTVLYGIYLPQLAKRITQLCKDERVKEALLEGASKRVITFRLVERTERYQECRFEEGVLVMQCMPYRLWTNIDTLGNDIEERLM